jgi:hypothetical protein
MAFPPGTTDGESNRTMRATIDAFAAELIATRLITKICHRHQYFLHRDRIDEFESMFFLMKQRNLRRGALERF